jgi:hypothetical protein
MRPGLITSSDDVDTSVRRYILQLREEAVASPVDRTAYRWIVGPYRVGSFASGLAPIANEQLDKAELKPARLVAEPEACRLETVHWLHATIGNLHKQAAARLPQGVYSSAMHTRTVNHFAAEMLAQPERIVKRIEDWLQPYPKD